MRSRCGSTHLLTGAPPCLQNRPVSRRIVQRSPSGRPRAVTAYRYRTRCLPGAEETRIHRQHEAHGTARLTRFSRAASRNTESQSFSRRSTKGSLPNSNTDSSRSTARWLWKSRNPVTVCSSRATVNFPEPGSPWKNTNHMSTAFESKARRRNAPGRHLVPHRLLMILATQKSGPVAGEDLRRKGPRMTRVCASNFGRPYPWPCRRLSPPTP